MSVDLINPLVGMGGALMALGEVELAIPFLERAVHISHVNSGVENVDQVEILDALSHAYLESGDVYTSSELQDAILLLRQRRAADDPEQYLDALEQRSNWYVRVGEYDNAVWSFRRLTSAIAKRYGDDDLRLIEPLVALADAGLKSAMQDADRGVRPVAAPQFRSSRTGRRCRGDGSCAGGILDESRQLPVAAQYGVFGEGMGALNHAVRIARIHESEHPEQLARTLVYQGDWLASLDQTRDAARRYREAWQILDEDPERHRVRNELFAIPTLVARAPNPPIVGQRADDLVDAAAYPQRGHTDISFDVDARGRPRKVKVISANPPGLMDGQIERHVRQFRFRPAFSSGKPRPFTGLVYRHTFRYDETLLTERERERIATTVYGADASSSSAPDDAIRVGGAPTT